MKTQTQEQMIAKMWEFWQILKQMDDKYGKDGQPGLKGEPGYTPLKGVDYFDGKDGKTPIKGVDYFDGEKGDKGDPGQRGKDLQPLSPEQTVEKINTSKVLIRLEKIFGLKAILDSLEATISRIVSKHVAAALGEIKTATPASASRLGKGGGMGDVKFKTFNGDGITTQFTLDFNVASKGSAIILIYQGQVLENGTHFTISGKTITTTFVPETSTTLFAWQIRA